MQQQKDGSGFLGFDDDADLRVAAEPKDQKKNFKLKGDLLYFFLNLGRGGTPPVFTEKYTDFKGIDAFLDLDQLCRYDGMIERLREEGSITASESVLLSQMPYCYFNAFIAWLDSAENIRIVIG